jgi:hypothetical protein
MIIVLRTVKGSNLTVAELDGNFTALDDRVSTLETSPPEAVSIDTIEIVGNQITVTMTDATTRGPFQIPTATWHAKGEWTAATNYLAFDLVTNSGNLYLILRAHLSDAVFDAAREDVDGFFYSLIFSAPAQPNDLHVFVGGQMNDAQLILFYQSTRRWQLPVDLIGSLFDAQSAADDATIIDLQKNGLSIGTLSWGIGQFVPIIDFTAAITFEIGDTFSIIGPATADATLADISFDLLGTRI